jgi:ribonuclease D
MNDTEPLPPPIWVNRPAGFRAMLGHLIGEPALAVDTESNSLYAYRERVCLIQISVPGVDYLIDPFVLNDLSELGPLFADPNVLKVLHGSEYDLSVLDRDFGFAFANLFDTMWASRILGWPAFGLAALLKAQFGVQLNKKYQRANWGIRPLPPEQLSYARLDTHYLLPLYEIQARELEVKKRWPQAHHRFRELLDTHWEVKPFDPEGFWRLPGVRDLDDAGRGVLREMYLLREKYAETENRPPFRVLANPALLGLSEQRPHQFSALHQIKGVSQRMARKYGKALLAAIQRGESHPLPWEARPRPNNGATNNNKNRASAACQARYQALRAWRNATAEARGVESDLVLTNQLLWDVAERNPRQCADLRRGGLLARWQVDEFGADLLKIVRNSR